MNKKTLSLVNNADLQVELNTGKTAVIFKGIEDKNLGIKISQIFTPHLLSKYGFGNGVKLNLGEGVKEESGEFLYIDAFGKNHYMKNKYYCVDANGEPYEISRNQLKINPNGDLVYMTLTKETKAYRELYSDDGLKAEIPYSKMEGTDLYEQRNEEIKKIEEKIFSYENALENIVQVTLSDGTVKFMTKSEVLTYESLILQKPYTEEQMDLIRWQIDEMQKTGEKNRAYIKNIYDTVDFSTIEDDSEKIEDYISYVAVFENGVIDFEIADKSEFSSYSYRQLGINENYLFTRLQLAQYRSLLSQFNTTLEDENQTVLKKQLANIQGQIDMLLEKSEENQHNYESYRKELSVLYDELAVMKKQAPIYYVIDENIVKGFNEDGDLCVIYNKNSDNYTVIERTKHYSTNGYKITKVCNKDGNGITLHYDDDVGLLREIINSLGEVTSYEYDSDENLVKVIYPNKQELTFDLTLDETGLSGFKVAYNNKFVQMSYANDMLSSVEYFANISNIENDTVIPQSIKKIDLVCGTSATLTNQEQQIVEAYTFDADGRITEHCVLENGKYTKAEKYEHVGMGKYNVSSVQENGLYGETVTFENMCQSTVTLDAFNRVKSEAVTNKKISDTDNGYKQDIVKTYTYNEKGQVSKVVTNEKIYTDISSPIKELNHIVLLEYNDRGQLLKKQSYTEGEEKANGINIEEHVYDKNGFEIKKITYNSLDPSSKYYEEIEVNEKGQKIAEFDLLGKNRTMYEYFDGTNTVCSTKYPNGSRYSFGVDNMNGNSAITQSTADGEENSIQKIYTNGLLTKVISDSNTYEYTYDYKDRVTSVTINGNEYAQYLYEKDNTTNTEKTTVTYADGSIEKHEVSPTTETKEIIKGESSKKLIKVISNGKVTSIIQQENGVNVNIIKYTYDSCGKLSTERLYEYLEDGELNEIYSQTYTYTANGKISCETINSTTNPRAMYNQYTYDILGNLKEYTYVNDGTTHKLKTDCLGRNRGKTISNYVEDIYSEDITYLKNGDHATKLPVAIQYSKKNGEALILGDNIRYKYDKMGNITKIYENGVLTVEHKYDTLGRLVRENNRGLNATAFYSYDNKGNIASKKLYGFSFESERELNESNAYRKIFNYSYDMVGNLISFDGNEITYDLLGNPTAYKGKTLEWGSGRKLTSYGDITFEYDAFGRRISKTGDSEITYEYNMQNQIFRQSNGIKFFYDNNSSVYAFEYLGEKYFYRKDIFGNVIEILDSEGNTVVKYVYDAWGNHSVLDANGAAITDEAHIGRINPIRYRSYYYDTETKLYYLNARYYDPTICRFISPDDISYLDPETIGGTNLYAYCNNNPVMYVDPSGNFLISILVGAVIGAISSAISYTASTVISFVITGEWNWSWSGFLGSIVGGALGGAFSAGLGFLGNSFLNKTGAFVSGFLTKAGSMQFENWIDGKNHTAKEILIISGFAGIFSFAFSDGSSSDLDTILFNKNLKQFGKNLMDSLEDGAGASLAEFYYSLFGFEKLTQQLVD